MTILTPVAAPAGDLSLPSLPLRRVKEGLMVGSVLIGRQEEAMLSQYLQHGGATRLQGYNGTIQVASLQPKINAYEITCLATHLFSNHCTPLWQWQQRSEWATDQLLWQIDQAPQGKFTSPSSIYATSKGFQIGKLFLPVPTALRKRLNNLEERQGDLWMGEFELGIHPQCAHTLIEYQQHQMIVERHSLLKATQTLLNPH